MIAVAMQRVARLLAFFVLAVAVVGVLAAVAIDIWFERPDLSQVGAFRVERADAALLAAARARERGTETAAPPATDEWPARRHSGFVQLRFEVLPDGRAANIAVVGAAPAGYYEEQARQEIARRRFVPMRTADGATTDTRTQIVEFTFVPREAAGDE